jgi:hypothetical protein
MQATSKQKQLAREYYKLQYYDPISLTWVDVQRAYDNFTLAKKALGTMDKGRIMHIKNKKRTVIYNNQVQTRQ